MYIEVMYVEDISRFLNTDITSCGFEGSSVAIEVMKKLKMKQKSMKGVTDSQGWVILMLQQNNEHVNLPCTTGCMESSESLLIM